MDFIEGIDPMKRRFRLFVAEEIAHALSAAYISTCWYSRKSSRRTAPRDAAHRLRRREAECSERTAHRKGSDCTGPGM